MMEMWMVGRVPREKLPSETPRPSEERLHVQNQSELSKWKAAEMFKVCFYLIN